MGSQRPGSDPRENSPSQGSWTRNVGPQLRILQLKSEGINRGKSEYLSNVLHEYAIEIVLLEETHAVTKAQLQIRGHTLEYNIILAMYDRRYGFSTYIKDSINNWKIIETSNLNEIPMITYEVAGVSVQNLYKPPNTKWPTNLPSLLKKLNYYTGFLLFFYQTNFKIRPVPIL